MAGPGTKRTDSPGALHQTPPSRARGGSSRRPVLGNHPKACSKPLPGALIRRISPETSSHRAEGLPRGLPQPSKIGGSSPRGQKGGGGASYTLHTSRPGDAVGTSSSATLHALCNRRARAHTQPGPTADSLERPLSRSNGSPGPTLAPTPLPYPPALAQACGPPPFPCELHLPITKTEF